MSIALSSQRWVLACLLTAGCITAPATQDQQLASRLVGTWSRIIHLDELRIEDTRELSADGTYSAHGFVHGAAGMQPYSVAGVWRVQDRRFVLEVRRSTLPDCCPGGGDLAREIVSVGDWEWVMVDGSGSEDRSWRYPK